MSPIITRKTIAFLDRLAKNNDNAIKKNGKIIVQGDYNINYLNKFKSSKRETVILRSFVNGDYFATLSRLGLRVETKRKPV